MKRFLYFWKALVAFYFSLYSSALYSLHSLCWAILGLNVSLLICGLTNCSLFRTEEMRRTVIDEASQIIKSDHKQGAVTKAAAPENGKI